MLLRLHESSSAPIWTMSREPLWRYLLWLYQFRHLSRSSPRHRLVSTDVLVRGELNPIYTSGSAVRCRTTSLACCIIEDTPDTNFSCSVSSLRYRSKAFPQIGRARSSTQLTGRTSNGLLHQGRTVASGHRHSGLLAGESGLS